MLLLVVLACTIAHAQTSQPAQRGAISLAFSEHAPLSSADEIKKRFRWSEKIDEIDLAKEQFKAYVPENYRSATPYGLFVWISAGPRGDVPNRGWLGVLDAHQLIWIGADDSANERAVADRLRLAIDAVFNMRQRYSIDEQRIYVGGVSGGGRAASIAASAFPDVFTGGGFFICGVNFFRDIPVPDKKNEIWQAAFKPPAASLLAEQKRMSRFVLLTGDNDFNLTNTLAVYNSGYVKEGYKYATLIQVPGMAHGLPDAQWFEKGIDALDEPLPEVRTAREMAAQQKVEQQAAREARKPASAPVKAPAGDTPTDPAKEADRLLNLARSYITAGSYPAARLRLEKIISTYPSTSQAREAKTLLEQIKDK